MTRIFQLEIVEFREVGFVGMFYFVCGFILFAFRNLMDFFSISPGVELDTRLRICIYYQSKGSSFEFVFSSILSYYQYSEKGIEKWKIFVKEKKNTIPTSVKNLTKFFPLVLFFIIILLCIYYNTEFQVFSLLVGILKGIIRFYESNEQKINNSCRKKEHTFNKRKIFNRILHIVQNFAL